LSGVGALPTGARRAILCGVPAASKRVRRILHLVDELDLDRTEIRALRDELDLRQECELDLDACKTPEDHTLASELKRRVDAAAQGHVELVPIADLLKRGRDELRRIDAVRQPARRRPSQR
jgi:hypothetical protein